MNQRRTDGPWSVGGGAKPHLSAARRAAGGLALLLVFLFLLLGRHSTSAQESSSLEKWIADTETALTNVDNYTAKFHRREWVGNKLIPDQVTFLKFKRPLQIYMRWISPNKGQESLFVKGVNHDRIKAHGTGLKGLVTVNLDPTGARAMENCRHPVTEAGLDHLVGIISTNFWRAVQAGELGAKDHGEQVVYGRTTREWEGVLPKERARGYYCYRCILNLDVETKMPIRTQIFDWDDRLVESYGYEQLELNPGLREKDFQPNNPEYHF